MTDKESGFAPANPSVEGDRPGREDEQLEPGDQEAEAPEDAIEKESAEAGAEGDGEAEEETRPRAPRRHFMRAFWLLVAVVAVVGALTVVELVRVATALNTSACIQRAQANFQEALGPGVSAQFAGLDRLAGQNQLKKCGP